MLLHTDKVPDYVLARAWDADQAQRLWQIGVRLSPKHAFLFFLSLYQKKKMEKPCYTTTVLFPPDLSLSPPS